MSQDLPPPGGFPKIKFARDVPNRTISAAAVGVGMTVLSIFGMFQIGSIWRERRYYQHE
jgi:hypothetical protein